MQTIIATINGIPIYRRDVAYLPSNAKLTSRARLLRKAGNLAEVIFWKQVHRGKFHHIDFDRQRVIGNYIVDFYIKSLGLIIEIDGASHNDKADYDARREGHLTALGLYLYRIIDYRVKHDLASVMAELEQYIIAHFGQKQTTK
ncbi:DNA methylase [Flavobacterium magnum]|uniref:DNA methylase n=1 Tax=Flavobacterium magnum TaxID=2162713 RepID=A0A2S0RFP7_9FLAO|nr:endonuclease domain-containing protein [Flavobacterium magnum]AWA29911.1 DNA methylase [Flavobacterium magnum]